MGCYCADTVWPAVTYNDGFLGQENEEYQAWILDKKHWGGAIELSVSSCAGYGVPQLPQPLVQGECPAPCRVGAWVASGWCTQFLPTSCMQSDAKSAALCCACLAYAPQILSKHYGRVIAAYDIQTKRCDR